MKTALPIITLGLLLLVLFLIYYFVLKPPTQSQINSQNLNAQNQLGLPTVLPSTIPPDTLAKIQVACMAPSTKLWFENLYKTKCSNFGF